MNRIVLTGATGLVGGSVLRELLRQDGVSRVTSLGRRPCRLSAPALREVMIADFTDATELEPHFACADTVFHCLAAYSHHVERDRYRQITLGYLDTLLAAAARVAPHSTVCLFSAAGARPGGGGLSYALKVKGEAETRLFTAPMPRKYAFRPGYIAPSRPRESPMLMDRVGMPLLKMLPSTGISSDGLARAMIRVALEESRPQAVFENRDIRRLAGG